MMREVRSGRCKGEQLLTQFEQVGKICLWWGTPPHSDQWGGGEGRGKGREEGEGDIRKIK